MSGWLEPRRAPSPARVGPLGIPGSALRCRQGSGCRRLAWLEMVRIVVQKGWKGHNFAIFRFRRRFSDNKEHIASVVQQSAPPLVIMEACAFMDPVPVSKSRVPSSVLGHDHAGRESAPPPRHLLHHVGEQALCRQCRHRQANSPVAHHQHEHG